MTYAHVQSLLEETGMSPEALAARLGISGMTLRRWRERPPGGGLPKLYASAIAGIVYEMVNDGTLPSDSALVRTIVEDAGIVPQAAVISEMGFGREVLSAGADASEGVIAGLSRIGGHEEKRTAVEGSGKKIRSFEKLGSDWRRRISTLLKVIMSRKLTMSEKVVAYGALFYLINPFDLIPDATPIFGLIDDYVILGFAAAYYMKRFAKVAI